VGKGTGLGLPMVQGLAQQSGGKFALSSAAGEGTKAEIWLRVAGAELQPSDAFVERRQAANGRAAQRLRILAVDDDPLVLENTSAMLGELGHEVLTASAGRDALKILRDESIDLLITDYAMPGMTGEELARCILADRPRFAILMVSGYADLPEGVAVSVPRLGKPFCEDQLARAIDEARHAAVKRAA
jgi:CheY-like chemotaxis protein